VILASLAMAAGACGLFLAAHGVGMLFAARALQGAAVGTATSALGAALIDLQPEGSAIAPVITIAAGQLGLAAGGLGTSALVQYGPAPARLIWWLLLGVSLAAAVAVPAMPETVSGRPGVLAALRPRVAVPRQARATFAMALPCLVAVWMLSGFCLSLGPSLAAQVAGSRDLLWGGLVIFLVAGTGAAGPVVFRGVSGPAAMLAGCLALLAGAVLTLAAMQTTSAAALLARPGSLPLPPIAAQCRLGRGCRFSGPNSSTQKTTSGSPACGVPACRRWRTTARSAPFSLYTAGPWRPFQVFRR
jgi:MFS family permease